MNTEQAIILAALIGTAVVGAVVGALLAALGSLADHKRRNL